jgi:hypothetical protein
MVEQFLVARLKRGHCFCHQSAGERSCRIAYLLPY